MNSALLENILPWLPVSYGGLALALNLFTLAMITEPTFRPASPFIRWSAQFTFLVGTMTFLINAGFYLANLGG